MQALCCKLAINECVTQVTMAVHDLSKLLTETVRRKLLRVGSSPLMVDDKRLCLESVVILDTRQGRETCCATTAVVEIICHIVRCLRPNNS